MNETNTPLFVCESLPNLGGFWRLRLVESKSILQQQFQTDTEIESLIFLNQNNFLADWHYADNFSGDLKIDSSITDSGTEEKFAFKAMLEVDAQPKQFREWHDRNVRNRRFALELTNNNGFVRVLNPFQITYSYLGQTNFENQNRYELTFTRAKMVNNLSGIHDNTIASVAVTCNTIIPEPEPEVDNAPLIFITISENVA